VNASTRILSRTTGLRAYWNLYIASAGEADPHFREFSVARAERAIQYRIYSLLAQERTERDEGKRAANGVYRLWKRLCAEQVEHKAAAYEALLAGDMAEFRWSHRQSRLILKDLDAAQAAAFPALADRRAA
jgi:hypothetical protein